MAFDDTTRKLLQNFVSSVRSILTEDFTRQFQNEYGIDPQIGEVSDISDLHQLDDAKRQTARLLRDTLNHYQAVNPSASKKDCIERIVREQAFTVLNRLCALRMAEARGIIVESIAKGYQSKGFQLYSRLAGTAHGEIGDAYQSFLFSLFDEFAMDLPVLFDRYSSMGRLFPRKSVLLELLEKINHLDIDPLWAEDETIGWIYQYFNSKAERKKMRDESQAPRNSRELAVRNQFFTPRYVVEFLTDNTLGRIWYEMTQGKTSLKETCRYLVRRPNEIFLEKGEDAPEQEKVSDDFSQEELLKQPVYIPFRPLKDPREIRMLDPACGSMHFGLYAFDLFELIYKEAWDIECRSENDPFERKEKFKPLTRIYSNQEEFLKDIPGLIIEYNIHGIDIDPRAVQIAGLSLWLRAQRSWKEQNIKPLNRHQICKSNIVCAEPMPGEKELLQDFTKKLKPLVLGQLVEIIFEKMEIAGEAGSLLKIEKEIEDALENAREEFNRALLNRNMKGQKTLFPDLEKAKQISLFDFADLPDKTKFWQTAEKQILDALKRYAEFAETLDTKRRLFAESAARGFAFIDLCRKHYDVVLMNPPFGECSISQDPYINKIYSNLSGNILCAFFERAKEMNFEHGGFAAIYDRTVIVKQSYTNFRKNLILPKSEMYTHLDLGWGVLDANVETSASVFLQEKKSDCVFIDARNDNLEKKGDSAFLSIRNFHNNELMENISIIATDIFFSYPNSVVGYDFPTYARQAFAKYRPLCKNGVRVIEGHTFITDIYLRYWWEIPLENAFQKHSKWQRLYNGSGYSRYVTNLCDVVFYGNNGEEIKNHKSTILRNLNLHQKALVGYGKRGEFLDAHILSPGFVSTVEGKAVIINDNISPFVVLALLNSKLFQSIINLYCGQHKHPGYVNIFPTPDLTSKTMIEIGKICEKIVQLKSILFSGDETSPTFMSTTEFFSINNNFLDKCHEIIKDINFNEEKLNRLIYNSYNLKVQEIDFIEKRCTKMPSNGFWFGSINEKLKAKLTLSYVIGLLFGRWDIYKATCENEASMLPGRIYNFSICPQGMLQNENGLPSQQEKIVRYPIRIHLNGIIVNDEGHTDDIIRRMNDVLLLIKKDKSLKIEQELCNALNINTLRYFFKNPNGFFDDHLKRYSKSRRQAPIYWPLSTPSNSYTLWIYYHRLNDQILYTCINDYVEPKLKQISESTTNLRQKTTRTRQEEKDLEKFTDFESELKEFRDELLRIAKFWKPNLNDGVQITAAPLWKLFQHKPWQNKLKATWKKMEKGDYDWAHLAYSIWPERVIRASHKDRSYAIAHDLEDDLWEEIETGKDRQGNPKYKWVPKELTEAELKQLIKQKISKQ